MVFWCIFYISEPMLIGLTSRSSTGNCHKLRKKWQELGPWHILYYNQKFDDGVNEVLSWFGINVHG